MPLLATSEHLDKLSGSYLELTGLKDLSLHYSGKFWTVLEYMGKEAPIDTQYVASYCVKSNQHVKHVNTGVPGSGMLPMKIWKKGAMRLNLGAL